MARRTALGGINTHVRMIGLPEAERDFATAGERMRKQRKLDMHKLGRLMVRDVKAEMPRTLGVVSGDTKDSINYKVLAGRRDGNPILIVGPSERKGNLLRIHEEGLMIVRKSGVQAQYGERPTMGPGVERSSSLQFQLLGKCLEVV